MKENWYLQKKKCLGCGDCWRACPYKGIIPGKPSWRLLLGGKLGRHPQLAREVGEFSNEEVVEYFKKAIDRILITNKPAQRCADLLMETKS